MLLDEIKATLAMEKLYLTPAEEQVLQDFAQGRISFSRLQAFVLEQLKNRKAA